MNLPARSLTFSVKKFPIAFGIICQYFFSKSVDFLTLSTYNDTRIIKTYYVFVRTALRRRSIFFVQKYFILNPHTKARKPA